MSEKAFWSMTLLFGRRALTVGRGMFEWQRTDYLCFGWTVSR